MDYKDYYDILGVSRDATQDQIKRAYRKLARKYHPDVSEAADADQRFKEAGEAYEVLKDPEKRAAYDQLGSGWQAGQDFRPPPDWGTEFDLGGGGGYTTADAAQFSDFFESLFGGAYGGAYTTGGGPFDGRGEDIDARVTIDLEDSYKGASRLLTLHSPEVMPDGRIRQQERTLNVSIPTGVKQGQKIRLAGQGQPGMGGEAGDLYLEVEFHPHPHYRVEAADVFLDLPVAPWEAALGATVKVPTPMGTVDLKIPAGSQQGRKLRLKGRGIPARSPGDLYVVLEIALPPADSRKAKKIYQEMEKEMDFNPRAGLGV
jgi:curved DNA-binding protein